MSLGTHLKELREKHKVDKSPTLKDVSEEINVSLGGLHAIEQGHVNKPDVITLKRLAAYYGVTLESLIDKIEVI